MSSDRGVSLVVPLQDEERTVRALLRSVSQQSHPPNEVVLVDAGSQDGTVEQAGMVVLPCPLKLVRAARVAPGVARNEGVDAATSEWIAFADGGTVLHPDWLKELLAATNPGVDVVFGGVEPICDSFFRECAAVAYVPPRGTQGTRGSFVPSSLIRRSKFLSVGGFPPYRAAEDLIFFDRLRAGGAVTAYTPKAIVRWEIAGGFGATFDRFKDYSYHNLVAGWGRHWHLGAARLYGALAAATATAIVVGGAWAWLLVPAFFVARAVKAAWLKRESFDFPSLRFTRILGASLILGVIDLATVVGCGRWLFEAVLNRAAPAERGYP